MFAVVDIETTGLRPGRDRIVEVAVVSVAEDGEVLNEWCTLIDPGGPVRGSRVHGIFSRHIKDAPTFGEVAGDLVERLGDAVFVAHNARFDSAFLTSEFGRIGHDVSWSWLCTLEFAAHLDFSWSRSLRACCANLGVPHDNGHSALVDAQATARLLTFLFAAAYERGVMVPLPPAVEASRLVLPKCGRYVHRPSPVEREGPPLRRLVSRLPGALVPPGADPDAVIAYTELLDRVLEDRLIAPDEAAALCELAGSWGLSMEDLGAIHRLYIAGLADVAMADGVLSREEHEDLGAVADLLGVSRAAVLEDLVVRG